jgi:hypothetical protein
LINLIAVRLCMPPLDVVCLFVVTAQAGIEISCRRRYPEFVKILKRLQQWESLSERPPRGLLRRAHTVAVHVRAAMGPRGRLSAGAAVPILVSGLLEEIVAKHAQD